MNRLLLLLSGEEWKLVTPNALIFLCCSQKKMLTKKFLFPDLLYTWVAKYYFSGSFVENSTHNSQNSDPVALLEIISKIFHH